MGVIKNKLIQKELNKELSVGDAVYVKKEIITKHHYVHTSQNKVLCHINSIDGDNVTVIVDKSYSNLMITITLPKSEIIIDTWEIGANPFPKKGWKGNLVIHNMDLMSIMSVLHLPVDDYSRERGDGYMVNGIYIKQCNFNPFVVDKNGNRQYYQRDFTWTLEDEQLFIESIYQDLDCGKIVLRKRSWEWVEQQVKNNDYSNVGFIDIVDGKQRINTLYRFMTDKFQDLHGNFYSDLSDKAQLQFERSMTISTLEMNEGVSDEEVIKTFLMVNYSGKPISKEHIDYVKNINEKMI